MKDLGTLPGYNESDANGITDSGNITGSSGRTGIGSHTYLYSNGVMQDLGTINGAPTCGAYDVNDSGQVCGVFGFSGSDLHGFYYSGGQMIPLPTTGGFARSQAYSINASGQIVGRMFNNPSVDYRGFFFENGVIYDLNYVLDSSGAGWFINWASKINDRGQIAGFGTNPSGDVHAILFTPVTTISGAITLQSYSQSPAGALVTIEIRNTGSTVPLESHQISLDDAGNFSFTTALAPGTYDIAVKAPHWLRQTLPNQTVGTFGVGGINYSLLNGDVNGDNAVTLGDFAAIRAAFGASEGDPNWNAGADLNGDGAVTLGDFAIMRANFGRQGDP